MAEVLLPKLSPAECPEQVKRIFDGDANELPPSACCEPVKTVVAEIPAAGTQLNLF